LPLIRGRHRSSIAAAIARRALLSRFFGAVVSVRSVPGLITAQHRGDLFPAPMLCPQRDGHIAMPFQSRAFRELQPALRVRAKCLC
jgi:hypothetical protein